MHITSQCQALLGTMVKLKTDSRFSLLLFTITGYLILCVSYCDASERVKRQSGAPEQ